MPPWLLAIKPFVDKAIGVGLIAGFLFMGLWYYGHIRYQAGVKDENIRWTADQQKIQDEGELIRRAVQAAATEIDLKNEQRLSHLQVVNKTVIQPTRQEIHEKLVYSNPDCRVTDGLRNAWKTLSIASGFDPGLDSGDGKTVPPNPAPSG